MLRARAHLQNISIINTALPNSLPESMTSLAFVATRSRSRFLERVSFRLIIHLLACDARTTLLRADQHHPSILISHHRYRPHQTANAWHNKTYKTQTSRIYGSSNKPNISTFTFVTHRGQYFISFVFPNRFCKCTLSTIPIGSVLHNVCIVNIGCIASPVLVGVTI